MLRTRVFAIVQATCAVLALWSSFTGAVLTPPVFGGQPVWSLYRLVQLLGFAGALLLWWRLRYGAALSVLFWAVQLFGLQGATFRLMLGTALALPLSLAIAPGTVREMNPPSLLISLNLVPVIALAVLTWIARHERLKADPLPGPAV